MQTSQKSIFDIIEETSTSSAEASHVSHTRRPGSDAEKKMTATSGQKCCDAFGRFPRVGSWARMFSALLIGQEGWSSTKCRLIWKLKGTKSNRLYFRLQASTLPTEGTGSGLLPTEMLPTPTTDSATNRKEKYKQGGTPLSVAANKMLPTPTTSCANGGTKAPRKDGKTRESELNHWATINRDESQATGKTSQLNPPFVAEMMGFPTDWTILPFLSGETKA